MCAMIDKHYKVTKTTSRVKALYMCAIIDKHYKVSVL